MGDGSVVPGSFVNARGVTLKTQVWFPPDRPVALVVFLHGLSTSTTSNAAWKRVAAAHNARGLLCAGLDYQGHGNSGGDWKDVHDNLDATVDDAVQFIEGLQASHASLQVFLRGQSMGGLIALAVALRRPDLVKGLALGAPAYQLPWLVTKFAPAAILSGGEAVKERLHILAPPLAVFQGVEDTTVDPAGARCLLESAGSPDRSLYLYKDMGHNMSIEADVLSWLLPRASGQTHAGAMLYVRRPIPGLTWQPPPPGSLEAAENTTLEVWTDREEQQRALDELVPEAVGVAQALGSYLRMLPMALRLWR